MKLIESAIQHFSSKAIRSIQVPEWDVTLFAKNMTLDDKAKMYARSNGNGTDYLVYAVIFGLQDKDGEAPFTLEDKSALKSKVDPEIVSRLANFVLQTEAKTEDDREKN